jgi:transcriptional antiterminator RfaH
LDARLTVAFWAACRLRPHRESVALHWLALKGFESYCPHIRDFQIRYGRRIEHRPALFPGYAFVLIRLQWSTVGSTPGVSGLIMNGSGPAKVPDRVIDEIRQREVDGLIELPKRSPPVRGDPVRILRGPFIGRLAIFADMKPRERVEILLQLLGSEQRVELPRDSIEAV